jgi:hypothetical protein
MRVSRNFMQMTDSEFASYGLSGCRLRLANILRSKIYDYMQIGIIAVYAALIILYLVFDDGSILDDNQLVFLYFLEIALLSFFILDITLYIISFRMLYLRDTWNIIDIVVITLSIAFVLLDIFSSSQSLKAFLKLRAVFRLLRVFLLIRKLNALRRISETGKRRRVVQPFTTNTKGYDMNSPLENVIRILTELVGQIDSSESAIITDLNYCIKAINSNQLYEAEVIFDQGDSPDKDGRLQVQDGENRNQDDILRLINTYSNKPVEVVEIGKNNVVSKVENLDRFDTKKVATTTASSKYLKVPMDLRAVANAESFTDLH